MSNSKGPEMLFWSVRGHVVRHMDGKIRYWLNNNKGNCMQVSEYDFFHLYFAYYA